MQLPLQITFRDIPHSDAMEQAVREKAGKLEQYNDQITSCRVVIEAPHKHQTKGHHYHVKLDITVPGREIVVKRDPGDDGTHEDAYVAIRDAFEAARRQLKNYSSKMRPQG